MLIERRELEMAPLLAKLVEDLHASLDLRRASVDTLFETLHAALPVLSERERHILFARYNNRSASTFADLAKRYAISRQRVHQIERDALTKLRTAFHAVFTAP
jgi:RNA polymerase sigma factor (sigma-70 family)